jgi:hypothetical protein
MSMYESIRLASSLPLHEGQRPVEACGPLPPRRRTPLRLKDARSDPPAASAAPCMRAPDSTPLLLVGAAAMVAVTEPVPPQRMAAAQVAVVGAAKAEAMLPRPPA